MHGILVKVNPEYTDGTVSILQPSGRILQPTAKSGLNLILIHYYQLPVDGYFALGTDQYIVHATSEHRDID